MPNIGMRAVLKVVALLILLALVAVPIVSVRLGHRVASSSSPRVQLREGKISELDGTEKLVPWAWASPPEIDRDAYRAYLDGE